MHLKKEYDTIKKSMFYDGSSVEGLYQRELNEKSYANPISNEDTINKSWHKLKRNMRTAAVESLSTQKVSQQKRIPYRTPCFVQKSQKATEKK